MVLSTLNSDSILNSDIREIITVDFISKILETVREKIKTIENIDGNITTLLNALLSSGMRDIKKGFLEITEETVEENIDLIDNILLKKETKVNQKFFLDKKEKDKIQYNIFAAIIIYSCSIKESYPLFSYLSDRFIDEKDKKNLDYDEKINVITKDIYGKQKEIITLLKKIFLFLSKYSIVLCNEQIDVSKEAKLLKRKDISLGDLKVILNKLGGICLLYKMDKDLEKYLLNIIKVLSIFIKTYGYFSSIKENINYSTFNRLKNNNFDKNNYISNLDKLYPILLSWSYLFRETEKLDLKESNFVPKAMTAKLVKLFKNSEIQREIGECDDTNKKKLLLQIACKRKEIFIKNNSIPYQKVFDYIRDLKINKLEEILDFFSINNLDYTQEELIFIFKNNLENSFIVKNKIYLEQVKLWASKNISIKNIKKLTKNDFKVLILHKKQDTNLETYEYSLDITEIGNLIDYLLEDKNNYKNYKEFLEIIENIKNDLKFIHKSADGYTDLKELVDSEFKYTQDIKGFKGEVKEIYDEYNLKEIIKRNKKILNGGEYTIVDLDNFYLLFGSILDKGLVNDLLITIFNLNRKDFFYIDEVLTNFTGTEENYKRLYDRGYINLILKYKELVNLYLDEEDFIDLGELLDEIDEEKMNFSNDCDDVETMTDIQKLKVELTEVYGKKQADILIDKFENKDDLRELLNIGKELNSFKETFVLWLKDKNNIENYQLKNLFLVMTFFIKRNIKSFNNIKNIFEIAFSLSKKTKRIKTINKEFKLNNQIDNPEGFKDTVLKFLKNGKKDIIYEYKKSLKTIKLDIISSNKLDNYLIKIVSRGSDIDKVKLGKQLDIIVSELINNFSTRLLSSKINKKSGKGTGSSTNLFKQYYLRELVKKENESYEEYLERVYKINWRNLIHGKISEDKGRKAVKNIYDSSNDVEYFFFEALDNLTIIIENFERLKGDIDISNLLNTFNNLLNSLKKNFKREFNL